MIHEVGVNLGQYLAAKRCPFEVVDGPERRGTVTFARERVVIERDQDVGDGFDENRISKRNPATYLTRLIGCKVTIYARAPNAGAFYWEHQRRAERVLDLVLANLYEIAKIRRNLCSFKSGRFVDAPDLKPTETPGGAIYELKFTFDRGVTNNDWLGDPPFTDLVIPEGMIKNTVKVLGATESGGESTEIASGTGNT